VVALTLEAIDRTEHTIRRNSGKVEPNGPTSAVAWLPSTCPMQEPQLVEIKDGWATLSEGWAVFGKAPEDAFERYVAGKRSMLRFGRAGTSPDHAIHDASSQVRSGQCWDELTGAE
jgi:hypothetical protein